MAMNMLLRRMNLRGVTTHGFRSSFRDWVGECTSFPREVAGYLEGHQAREPMTAGDTSGSWYMDASERGRPTSGARAGRLHGDQ
jgi:hypothetical protein